MNELIGVITPDNTYNISGEVSGESTLSGIVTAGAQYEAYSGSYSVTPSGSVQTLETDGKLMTDDVTVGAIPSDYIGTDIPRRSTISVSQDNNTIHVEDGYYENDIDTSMGACTVTGASVWIDSQGDATGSIIVGRGGYITSGSHAFYVDDVVTPRSSSDLTASGATVSVPYGYYSADASKTVASGSATTPATSITANPSISVSNSGLITATVSGSKSVTPTVSAGYVSSGTSGTVSVSGSNTSQLSTQAGATITPTTSQQTAVASGKYTTGAVVVDAMPTGTAGTPTATKGSVSNHSVNVTPSVTNTTGYITGGTKTGTAVSVSASELDSGTKSITSNGSSQDVVGYASVNVNVPNSYSAGDEGKVVSSGALVSQTAHADVTPTTSDQTIDTTTNNSIKVKGDADLVAGNIKKNVEIFGVTGSYEGGGGGGTQIGIQTPNANLLAMMYALEHGTAKTGTFTLSTTLPNTATTIFDANDTTVTNFVIMAENVQATNTGTTNAATFAMNLFWIQSQTLRQIFSSPLNNRQDNVGNYLSVANNKDISITSSSNAYISAYWDWSNGVLSVKAQYNKHATYTPFASGVTYRWVAW